MRAQRDSKPAFSRPQQGCPFSGEGAEKIDYKNIRQMQRGISETGKMTPSRITGVCQKKQREFAKHVKRARFLALIPYTAQV